VNRNQIALVIRATHAHYPEDSPYAKANGVPIYACEKCEQDWPCEVRRLLDLIPNPETTP
jgi:hypothetical protein